MSRVQPLWLASLLLAALAGPGAPNASAATAQEVSIPDGADDVRFLEPSTPGAAPESTGLDITEVRVFGETGERVLIQVAVADIMGEVDHPSIVTGAEILVVCFSWNNVEYAFEVRYNYQVGPTVTSRSFGVVSSPCAFTDALRTHTLQFVAGQFTTNHGSIPVYMDVPNNVIELTVNRLVLASFTDAAPPKAGDALGDVRAFLYDGRATRVDAAPDAAPHTEALTLTLQTANIDLKAYPASNVPTTVPCGGRSDRRSYAIEAGGKRGIPIVVENTAPSARTVLLSVETLEGAKWDPKMMPQVSVPPASSTSTGNVTVNVIVDTPAGTRHKDCATLVVRATDSVDAGLVGESLINVVAVNPPGPTANRLYMHTSDKAANTCTVRDETWLNTLQTDGEQREILLNSCREAVSSAAVSYVGTGTITNLDVNPSHDLVLNTSVTGKKATALLAFRSEGTATEAEITATLFRDVRIPDPISEAKARITIGTTRTEVTFDLPVAFLREYEANGDPSRIIEARDGLGIMVRYTPLPAQPDPAPIAAPVPVAGKVFLLTEGAYVDLPIFDTIKRNVNDPGEAGGLLSLSATDMLPEYAAPGAARVLNFTVLNEGAATDAAIPAVTLSGAAGWTAAILPADPIVLAPGESAPFHVVVTPPSTAKESESVFVDVVVTSQSDPTARAAMTARLTATLAGGVEVDVLPPQVKVEGRGGLPGPSALILLVVWGLVAWVGRRRS